MALNGCSFPPFLIPAPCPLAPHGDLQKQILHLDYEDKKWTWRKMTSSVTEQQLKTTAAQTGLVLFR